MLQITPFIHFNGNTEEAFLFYQSVLGGKFTRVKRYREIATPEFQVSEKEAEKIMHISLAVGNNVVISGSDVPEMFGKVNELENRSKILISAASSEEAFRIYRGLAADGTVEVPMEENVPGPCFGMFRDKYGIEWMVEFTQL